MGVADNVCGDEACTPGEFGYTCGKRREQATEKRRELLFRSIPVIKAPMFGELTPNPGVHQFLPTNNKQYIPSSQMQRLIPPGGHL